MILNKPHPVCLGHQSQHRDIHEPVRRLQGALSVVISTVAITGADAGMGILIDDVVIDIDAIERLPEDDAVSAVIGHDVVVNFHIGDGGVTGDLNAVGGVGGESGGGGKEWSSGRTDGAVLRDESDVSGSNGDTSGSKK